MKTNAVGLVLFGILLGIVGTLGFQRSFPHHHRPDPERLARKFTRELGLKEDQQKVVRKTLEASAEKLRKLHQETSAKFKEIRAAMRTEVRKILDTDQQKKFDQMTERWDRRHKADDAYSESTRNP